MYKYSFIVASRNDNHGGNMRAKNIFFINRWLHSIKKYNLNCELIIVDWNSKIPLRKIIKTSLSNKKETIKIIEVPARIHEKIKNSKKINFFQMIAKNVGARRANGKFLIFTNVDIIFSEKFFSYLKNNTIKNETIYRTNRHDVDLKNLKKYLISEDIIEELTTHIQKINYTYDIKKNKKIYLRKTFINLLIQLGRNALHISLLIYISFIDFLANLIKLKTSNIKLLKLKKIILNNLKLFKDMLNINNLKTLFDKKLHTNACGDFTMIDKKSFYKMSGYNEFEGFSWHIDSLLLFKAYYYFKLNFINLKFPIYHINHEPGKTYSENKKISIKKIKRIKLDFITDEKLLNLIKNYRLKKLDNNDKKNWGLAKEKLSIHNI
jgi:hypothetical protein